MLKFTIQTFVVISLLSHFGYANDYPCTMPAELETWVSFLPDNSPEWIDTGNWSLSYTIPTGLEARFEIISTELLDNVTYGPATNGFFNCSVNGFSWSPSGEVQQSGITIMKRDDNVWDTWSHVQEYVFYYNGTYSVTSNDLGWSNCTGDCGRNITGNSSTVTFNLSGMNPIPTPTPTFTPTPTPTQTLCATPSKAISLSFARGDTVVIQNQLLDAYLLDGFYALREDNDGSGGNDVSCCFKINRSGDLEQNLITETYLQVIDSWIEVGLVRMKTYGCAIVNDFSGSYTGYKGVSVLNQNCFIVKNFSGISNVIYHEYGHTQGLEDLTGINNSDFLMYEYYGPNWYTNSNNCETF